MTTFVLVHGAWHGPWAWDRVVPLLHRAGARTVTPDLNAAADAGLHDHAEEVASALDAVHGPDSVFLVGHSYAGLAVREAADIRPDLVDHIVLVDGWAGAHGESLLDLAPPAFADAVHAAADERGAGRVVPPPAPSAFGVTDPADAVWLAQRLRPQPLRSFTEPTRLSGAVNRIPGTALCCRPHAYPFDRFAEAAGYRTQPLDAAHDVPLTDPETLAALLLHTASTGPVREQEA
ncbi:alpha/beta fold hydrolase [Streptomyces sp. NPDC093094]|uniref:alpha/beta hydrolase n=1 Tax=Streptomyces sp. NPDC093094 TaxID=3366026 RepID=UPI00381D4B47